MTPKAVVTLPELAKLFNQQPERPLEAQLSIKAAEENRKASEQLAELLFRQAHNPYQKITLENGEIVQAKMALVNSDNPKEGFIRHIYRNFGMIPDVAARRNGCLKNQLEYLFAELLPANQQLRFLTITSGENCRVKELVVKYEELREKMRGLMRLRWFKREADVLLMVYEEPIKERSGRLYYHPHLHLIYRVKTKSSLNNWQNDLQQYLKTVIKDEQVTDISRLIGYCFKKIDYLRWKEYPAELAKLADVFPEIRRFDVLGSLRKERQKLNASKLRPYKMGIDPQTKRPIWKLVKKASKPSRLQQKVDRHALKDLDITKPQQSIIQKKSSVMKFNKLAGCNFNWGRDGKKHLYRVILNPEPGRSLEEIFQAAKKMNSKLKLPKS
jgi:uncharacterized protein YggU (UPF0235/DUF167 family)